MARTIGLMLWCLGQEPSRDHDAIISVERISTNSSRWLSSQGKLPAKPKDKTNGNNMQCIAHKKEAENPRMSKYLLIICIWLPKFDYKSTTTATILQRKRF